MPVSVSCSPFDSTLTVFTTEVSVTIERRWRDAHASGGVAAGYPGAMVFACDGTSQPVTGLQPLIRTRRVFTQDRPPSLCL